MRPDLNSAGAPESSPDLELLRRKLARERSAREEAERLIEGKSLALYQAKIEAEAASRAKTAFLANMGHELRTPLNAVIGFSDLLIQQLARDLTPQHMSYLKEILGAGTRLLEVFDQVIEMARLERDRPALTFAPVDVADLLAFVAEAAGGLTHEAGIRLETSVAADMPRFDGDRDALAKALANVVANAIKFSHPGGTVRMDAFLSRRERVVVRVRDEGIGIPQDELRLVTQSFYQADGGRARRYEGTGLGLSIAKSLIDGHGGELVLASRVGKGTSVTILVPLRQPNAAHAERSPTSA